MGSKLFYAKINPRVHALVVDSLILIAVFASVLSLITLIQPGSGAVRASILIGSVVLWEPLWVSLTGGSVGHHLFGLKIYHVERVSRISFINSLTRFLVKILLGWLSFIFIVLTKQYQALHDKLSHSVVVTERPEQGRWEFGVEQQSVLSSKYVYPSAFRRILVIAFYLIITFALITLVLTSALSMECLNFDHCSPSEKLVGDMAGYGGLLLILLSVVVGWKGFLIGARRRPKTLASS